MVLLNIAVDAHRSKTMNFAYCFRPVYYFSRIFGFTPYTIIYDSNGRIQVPKIRVLDIIWLILSIFAQILSPILYTRNEKFSIYHINLAILIRADAIIIAVRTIFNISAIVMDMCNRYKLVETLKKLDDFDDHVREKKRKFSDQNLTIIINFVKCL